MWGLWPVGVLAGLNFDCGDWAVGIAVADGRVLSLQSSAAPLPNEDHTQEQPQSTLQEE